MMIFLEDSFDSAHFLPNVPDGHKCKNMHGHTYRIRIEVFGKVGETTGWVIDYSEIKSNWEPIKTMLDHHLLNDLIGLQNPTCELIAKFIWDRLRTWIPISRIELRETEHCGVVYEGE